MMQKALWYASRKHNYCFVDKTKGEGGEDTFTFYIMSKSNTDVSAKIDATRVSRYKALLQGERPKGMTNLDKIIELAASVHRVQYSEDAGRACPLCDMNPEDLVCGCKGFRHIGICSHVIVTNHWLDAINLRHVMGSIDPEKRLKGGFHQGVKPALTPELTNSAKKSKRRRLK